MRTQEEIISEIEALQEELKGLNTHADDPEVIEKRKKWVDSHLSEKGLKL